MDSAKDRPGPRIRDRPGKPASAPWTYRCRLTGPNVTVDVDAFSIKEAAAAAAAHWDVDGGEVEVEGRRRWWMRWLGVSTHDAKWDDPAMDRDWWLWSKIGLVGVLVLAVAWPIGTGIGGALREHRELSLEVQRAELERLRAENAALAAQAAEDTGDGG